VIPDDSPIRVGEQFRVIPNHICHRINLQDQVFLISGDQVIDQWKVAARGMVT
jgi:D-serine deaminase-like pyridoxal phosphate-dependent protein